MNFRKLAGGIAGALFLAASIAGTAHAQSIAEAGGTYNVDPSHAHIAFTINHIGFADTRGQFRKISGEYMLDPDNLNNSHVEIVVEAGSVDTIDDKRDEHLRTADFFNAEKFPTISFKSTGIERTGDMTAKLTGDVTMLGVTKPVTFDVVLRNAAPHPFRNELFRTGWSATATIKRSDFGMSFGLPLIGDEVQLNIEIEGDRV